MSIHLIELPYHPYATLNLFETLSNTSWSMLLYSGHNNKHPDSRFDILVTDPTLTLITHNNTTTVSCNKQHQVNNADPFLLLNKYIHIMNMQSENNFQLPFQGGFVGVFGYDLARYIESLPKLAKQDLSFPDMAIGLYRWAIISDHKLCKNYLVTHDNPKKILNWVYKQQHIYNNHISKTSFRLTQSWKSNMSRSEYAQKFHTIKKNIIAGNCYQVCLSQRFSASYIGDEWTAFRYLLHYNHAPFSAFMRLPNKLSILSLSPERFLQLHDTKIKTQPIKGTLSRLKNVQDDYQQIIKLSESTKDQSENLMIVDLLRNDIGKVAVPGSIHVSKLFDVQSFPGVHHMISTITGELSNNFSACDLLRACFPGGSIIGAPKVQVMKLIEQLEPQRRNIWSGNIGYLSCCGNMDTNIAIRTLLAERQYLFCSVGSGIIFDSDEESEYQEMQDKVSTILLPLLKKFYFK